MSMSICPFKDCHTIVTHGHGTSTKYLPNPEHRTDETPDETLYPGSMDALLLKAFEAGAQAQAVWAAREKNQWADEEPPSRETALKYFREWRARMLP